MNKFWRYSIKIGLVVIPLYVISRWLLPIFTTEEFKLFVESMGIYGPLIIIGYTVFSHILAPIIGSPAAILSFAIFGFYPTMSYLFIGSMISAVTNFYIAQKLGREWVTTLAGKETMKQVDDFTEVAGTKVLIASRIFGYTIFEVVSYAAGLTNISFKQYFTITVFFHAVPVIIFSLLFKDVDFSTGEGMAIWVGNYTVAAIVFSFILGKYIKEHRQRKKLEEEEKQTS